MRGDKMIGIKTFPLRITNEFHQVVKQAARDADTSIHDYIVKAVQDKLQKDKEV